MFGRGLGCRGRGFWCFGHGFTVAGHGCFHVGHGFFAAGRGLFAVGHGFLRGGRGFLLNRSTNRPIGLKNRLFRSRSSAAEANRERIVANGFLEMSDSDLLNWGRVFGSKIQQDPSFYGLSEEQSATFAELYDSYRTAFNQNVPAIRSPVTAKGKRAARAALLGEARLLVRIISGQKNITDADRIDLGLPGRSTRSRIAPPDERPILHVTSVVSHRVSLKVANKPASAIGLTLFYYVGDACPAASVENWQFVDNYSRSSFDVEFPFTLPPGTKLWLCGRWMNARLQAGQLCLPIFTHLQGGSIGAFFKRAT